LWFEIQAVVKVQRTTLSLKYNQQYATFSRYIYLYKLLYMFQEVPPPIIRSTKLYIQRKVLSDQYYIAAYRLQYCSRFPVASVPSSLFRALPNRISVQIPESRCSVDPISKCICEAPVLFTHTVSVG
jgi:hypothetical protein